MTRYIERGEINGKKMANEKAAGSLVHGSVQLWQSRSLITQAKRVREKKKELTRYRKIKRTTLFLLLKNARLNAISL